MGRISVLGGSVCGLYAALTLAADGHDVTVFERDPAPPADRDEAFLDWQRPGTPQLRQSHLYLARAVRMLKADHPGLYALLREIGSPEVRLVDHLPPWVTDRAPREGDDELVVLAVRRPVFDWALHTYAGDNGVRIERTAVTGLALDGSHVTGVTLEDGSAYAADLVVDASGRRTRTPTWLADAGVDLPEEGSPCGNRYYTRYYALRPGATPPPMRRGFGDMAELDAATMLVFAGDGTTFSVTMQTDDRDEELKGLHDPRGFVAAATTVPVTAPWVDPALATPLTDPVVMAGQHNRLRRTVADGRPLVTGLLLAGDATATTNPTYGRGVTMALTTSALLREALAHNDPGDVALAYDAALTREVEPFVRSSREVDARTLARWRHARTGEPLPPRPDGVTYEDVGLAAMRERDVYQAFVAMAGNLRTPDDVQSDPVVVAAVEAVKAEGFAMPRSPVPTRDEVAAAIVAATR